MVRREGIMFCLEVLVLSLVNAAFLDEAAINTVAIVYGLRDLHLVMSRRKFKP